ANIQPLLPNFFGLVERPLVVFFRTVDHSGVVSAMRPDGDHGENDADHADCYTDRLTKRISRVVVVPGMNLDLCHQNLRDVGKSASRILLEETLALILTE